MFASSTAVYGDGNVEVVDEESVCKPELFKGDPGPAYGQVFNVVCEPIVSTRRIREILGWKPKFTTSICH